MSKKQDKPHIVFFDLETMPNLIESMKVFPQLSQYPGLTLKATINSIICFGYKIQGQKKSKVINAWDFNEWNSDINNDEKLVKEAYKILINADVVITHNGKRFDWKFFQTRLMAHGLPPLKKIIHIDTCAEAKRNLFLFNNRLNTLAKLLTKIEKLDHEGWGLWVKVMQKDEKAMKIMSKYCKQDVDVLEQVFLKLRPFITQIPNHNFFKNDILGFCPTCGSANIIKNGQRYTKQGPKQQYSCNDCGSWSTQGKKYISA